MTDTAWLRSFIRDVDDFPRPGVRFKDITPLLDDIDAFRFTIDALADHFAGLGIDHIVGIESRGFILAAPVAYRLGASLVPARKPGKLPGPTISVEYALEYGTDTLEMHVDAIGPGTSVAIIDDVLATGGTAAATAELVAKAGGVVAGFGFLIELGFLQGSGKLEGFEITSLLRYE